MHTRLASSYCPDLRILPKEDFDFNTLGSILENYIDAVNTELKKTIESSGLGPNEKDQALRQVLLALRNTKSYYRYKEILTQEEGNLTQTQSQREETLSNMLREIESKTTKWKALEESAIAFIESNFNYYKQQPKVTRVESYIIFKSNFATLKIEGNFYYSEGIELVFANKSMYKPIEVDRNHKYIIFKIKINDFCLDKSEMKNSYSIATLKCPWKHKGLFSAKTVEANFDIVLATFPPHPGVVSYVARKALSSTKSGHIEGSSSYEKKAEVKYLDIPQTVQLNWNEVTTIHMVGNEIISEMKFQDFAGETFSITKLPQYVRVEEITRRKYYDFTAIFPLEENMAVIQN